MLKNKELKAGCTVHYVNEKLDSGRNILQNILLLTAMIMKVLKGKNSKT